MNRSLIGGMLVWSALAAATQVHAQEAFPSRPITIVVPLSAGSQIDILGRALADAIGRASNQPVVVQNREGAATTIGVEAVARAKADGYTIGFGPDGAFTVQPSLNAALPYKADDFEFICQTNSAMFLFLVGPQSPYKTMAGLIEAARKAPGKLNFGTAGVATSMHLLAESVAQEAGVKFNHVPFRNIGDLVVQTLNGTLDFTVSVPNMLNANSVKGMRALSVSGDGRVPNLPVLPLLRDLGFKQAAPASVIGMYAPKGLPADAQAWLRNACMRAAESPGFTATSAKTLTAVEIADGATYGRAIAQGNRAAADLLKKIELKTQ